MFFLFFFQSKIKYKLFISWRNQKSKRNLFDNLFRKLIKTRKNKSKNIYKLTKGKQYISNKYNITNKKQ